MKPNYDTIYKVSRRGGHYKCSKCKTFRHPTLPKSHDSTNREHCVSHRYGTITANISHRGLRANDGVSSAVLSFVAQSRTLSSESERYGFLARRTP